MAIDLRDGKWNLTIISFFLTVIFTYLWAIFHSNPYHILASSHILAWISGLVFIVSLIINLKKISGRITIPQNAIIFGIITAILVFAPVLPTITNWLGDIFFIWAGLVTLFFLVCVYFLVERDELATNLLKWLMSGIIFFVLAIISPILMLVVSPPSDPMGGLIVVIFGVGALIIIATALVETIVLNYVKRR